MSTNRYDYKHKIIIIVSLTAVMGFQGQSIHLAWLLGEPTNKLELVAKDFNFESSC